MASKILRGRISSSQPRGPSAMTVAADESPANLNYNYCCLPGPQRKCELVLHWKQLTSIWIVFFVIAGVSYHAPPVMMPAIMDEFHTDQYHVSWIPAVFQLMKGIFTVPGGFALDIFGCTRCLRAGSLVVLVCSALYPMAPSLWWLASLQGVYGVAYNLSGIAASRWHFGKGFWSLCGSYSGNTFKGPKTTTQACIVFLTSWFEQQRALAIAILTTAFSMAGVCFPPLIGSLIQHHGWRMASCVGPVLMVFLVLPLAFLALRDGTLLRPRSQRQHFQAAASFHLTLYRDCLDAFLASMHQLFLLLLLCCLCFCCCGGCGFCDCCCCCLCCCIAVVALPLLPPPLLLLLELDVGDRHRHSTSTGK